MGDQGGYYYYYYQPEETYYTGQDGVPQQQPILRGYVVPEWEEQNRAMLQQGQHPG